MIRIMKYGEVANADIFARVVPEVDVQKTLSLRGFAQHMTDHNSHFSRAIVEGVLLQIVECLPELLAQGVPVKLGTLGTFYPSLESEGAVSAEDFTIDMIKGVHMRFLPTSSATDNINSKE